MLIAEFLFLLDQCNESVYILILIHMAMLFECFFSFKYHFNKKIWLLTNIFVSFSLTELTLSCSERCFWIVIGLRWRRRRR